jgi:type VI secretion system secreted protein Hcp
MNDKDESDVPRTEEPTPNGESVMAAVDYFLKIDGIEGESTDDKHKGEIDLESWSWGAFNDAHQAEGRGHGAGVGKATVKDFHFAMKVNKASPKLMLACVFGEHIAKAILTCRKAGGEQQEFLKITMSNVFVKTYDIGGSSEDVIPADKISLNFSKIEFEYKAQDEKGKVGAPVKGGADLKLFKRV